MGLVGLLNHDDGDGVDVGEGDEYLAYSVHTVVESVSLHVGVLGADHTVVHDDRRGCHRDADVVHDHHVPCWDHNQTFHAHHHYVLGGDARDQIGCHDAGCRMDRDHNYRRSDKR